MQVHRPESHRKHMVFSTFRVWCCTVLSWDVCFWCISASPVMFDSCCRFQCISHGSLFQPRNKNSSNSEFLISQFWLLFFFSHNSEFASLQFWLFFFRIKRCIQFWEVKSYCKFTTDKCEKLANARKKSEIWEKKIWIVRKMSEMWDIKSQLPFFLFFYSLEKTSLSK